MDSILLATYYILDKIYNVYGVRDEATPEDEFDYYDVFEEEKKQQLCINEGSPFDELPTRDEVIEFIEDNE